MHIKQGHHFISPVFSFSFDKKFKIQFKTLQTMYSFFPKQM